jgi:hypothetical protein
MAPIGATAVTLSKLEVQLKESVGLRTQSKSAQKERMGPGNPELRWVARRVFRRRAPAAEKVGID